jgi:hypothetical protein
VRQERCSKYTMSFGVSIRKLISLLVLPNNIMVFEDSILNQYRLVPLVWNYMVVLYFLSFSWYQMPATRVRSLQFPLRAIRSKYFLVFCVLPLVLFLNLVKKYLKRICLSLRLVNKFMYSLHQTILTKSVMRFLCPKVCYWKHFVFLSGFINY